MERTIRHGAAGCRTATNADPGAEAWRLISVLFMEQKGRWMALAQEFELSPMQLRAINVLDPDQPIQMNDLAGQLACDASNVTGIVDRLEARGLVERRPAEHDRRVKILAVTDDGAALRRRTMERMWAPPPAIAALPKADQVVLRDLIRKALEQRPR